jgi:hypothetical protein
MPAAAALSCEQLFAVLESAVRFRHQGYSLEQVLGGLKQVETDGKLEPAEIDALRRSIAAVFMWEVSSKEVALECVRARDAGKR